MKHIWHVDDSGAILTMLGTAPSAEKAIEVCKAEILKVKQNGDLPDGVRLISNPIETDDLRAWTQIPDEEDGVATRTSI